MLLPLETESILDFFTAYALLWEQILRKYHLVQLWRSEEGGRFTLSSQRTLVLTLSLFQVYITQLLSDFDKTDSQKHQAEGISYRPFNYLGLQGGLGNVGPSSTDSHVADGHMKFYTLSIKLI